MVHLVVIKLIAMVMIIGAVVSCGKGTTTERVPYVPIAEIVVNKLCIQACIDYQFTNYHHSKSALMGSSSSSTGEYSIFKQLHRYCVNYMVDEQCAQVKYGPSGTHNLMRDVFDSQYHLLK